MDTSALDLNRHPYSSRALTHSNDVLGSRAPAARSAMTPAAPRSLTHGAPDSREIRDREPQRDRYTNGIDLETPPVQAFEIGS